jgi:hypothetical protein
MMNRFESNIPGAREAKLRYEDADFSILAQGDYVRCAVSGQPIRLDELKYWSVARQEPYATAEIAFRRHLELEG